MLTSRNIKRRSPVQCLVEKEKRECLTHEKMLAHIAQYASVGWESRVFNYKKRALEIFQGLPFVSSIER